MRQAHRRAQRRLERQLAQIGGEEHGHIARRGIHLAGCRPVIVALLVAGLADRRAVVAVALYRAWLVLEGQPSARTVVAPRQRGGTHAERTQHALIEQLVDRHAEPALERKLQQDIAGMGVEMLAAGQAVGPPSVVAEPAVLTPLNITVARPWLGDGGRAGVDHDADAVEGERYGGAGRIRTNEKSVSQTVGINSKSADDRLPLQQEVSTGTQPRPPPLSTSISTRGSAGGWWCGPSSRDINVLKLNNQRSIIDVAFAF